MKKLIVGILMCCVMQGSLTARDYYLSPTGSDDNAGSKQRPFATLTRARDAIRQARIAGKEPVNVIMADGARVSLEAGFLVVVHTPGRA